MPDLQTRLREVLHQPAHSDRPRIESVTELADLSGLGGHWFESPNGPGYVIESVYEPGHTHGTVALHRGLALDLSRLAGQVRDPRLANCDPAGLLYVDTETTGLGGAGSMVFLAGAAHFDGSMLKLRQYLLPAPQYESGLLGGLAEELSTASGLVSYNGKSFDLPLLESRYILSRMRPAWRALPHLDLLHPNRRLFRGSFDSHRLVRMEVELLGFERDDDCPSAEVPGRYFQFQRSSDPTHILPVLRHNAWDILSLVALAARLASVCDDAGFPLQVARAAEYEGNYATAALHFEAAAASSTARGQCIEAMEHAATCHARAGDFAAAARWWRALIDEPRSRRLTPYIELAKIEEHRNRDIAAAHALIDEAAGLVARGLLRPGAGSGAAGAPALEHRLERLRRKLQRPASAVQ